MLTGELFGTYSSKLTNFEADLVGFLTEWLNQPEPKVAESIVYDASYQFKILRDEATATPVVYFRMAERNGTFRDFTNFAARHPFAVLGLIFHNAKRRAESIETGEPR